jgi:uncharacterized membrane protein YraQ (UPF0718 family)
MEDDLKSAFVKSANAFYVSLPTLFGIVLLIGLASVLIPPSFYSGVFRGNLIFDSIVGSAIGSILAGNPITSYVLGGEFLKEGVSLIAVTAFLVAWVTVGVVQLPAESVLLGKRFAIYRNVLSFVSAIVVAILTVLILEAI